MNNSLRSLNFVPLVFLGLFPLWLGAVPVKENNNAGVKGRVWEDVNHNGIQGDLSLEPGVPDLSIELSFAGADGVFGEGNDDQVWQTLTGSTGEYQFDGLVPGNYRLRLLSVPENYILTLADQGMDEARDSDAAPVAEFSVSNPDEQLSQDIGIAAAPNIEAGLVIVGVDFPPSEICGRFTLILESEIRNTGQTVLQDLQAYIDFSLAGAFGTAYTGLVSAPELLNRSRSQSLPVLNAAFDGAANPLVFDGQSGVLLPGESLALRFAIEVYPQANTAPPDPQASLKATGLAFNEAGSVLPDYSKNEDSGLFVEDWSDNSLFLNGTYQDGDAPTPLGDCWKSAGNLAANAQVNVTVDESCSVLLTPEMLLTNPLLECGNKVLSQGSYYRLFRNGTEITEPADVSHLIGQTLEFEVRSVIDPCSPVSGSFHFVDNSPPLVECPEDVYLICSDLDSVLSNSATLDPTSQLFTGLPVITDNCSEVKDFTWSDQLLYFGCPLGDVKNGDGQQHYAAILRTFKASDAEGNVSSGCKQIIYLDRPPFEEPPAEVKLDFCKEDIPLDEQGHPHPDITGYPFYVNGFGDTVRLSKFHCNYSAAYQDQRFEGPCAGAHKVIRRWTVSDWCGTDGTRSFDQVIEVGDFSAPTISCNTIDASRQDTLTYSTGPFNCAAAFLLPEPDVTGECSGYQIETAVYSYRQPTDPFGNPYGEPEFVKLDVHIADGAASGVPTGVNYFVYTVTDICGNQAVSDPCVFKVEDKVEPVAICGDNLNVSLGGSGLARLLPEDIDKGSRDNCGTIKGRLRRHLSENCLEEYLQSFYGLSSQDLEVAGNALLYNGEPVLYLESGQYYTPWKEDVFLTCCDIGSTVRVELQVTDAVGNQNTCAVEVLVEDKITPQCLPPSNREADCRSLAGINIQDTTFLQAQFGRAGVLDNCAAVSRELAPVIDLDDCGAGTITRRFQAIDASGNTSGVCQQLITVRQVHDYVLRFPADAGSTQCGMGTVDTLTYQAGACDLLAVNVEESTFQGDGEACFKIFRTYRVINWCEYDGIADPLLIGRNEDQDATAGEEPVFLLRTPERGPFLDNNNDLSDGYLREVDGLGFWQYTQIIEVFDQRAPEVITEPLDPFCSLGTPDDCSGTAEIHFSITDSCSATGLQVRIDFDEGADGRVERELSNTAAVQVAGNQYTVSSTFPVGAHRLVIRATDACGNLVVREIPFSIVDCKAPSPVCIQELAVELMPVDSDEDGVPDTAFALLNVDDLFATGTLTDCSGEVSLSINREGETPDREQSQVRFSCADAGGTVMLELYAWDSADNPYALQPDSTLGGPNYDFCTIAVNVQDNQNLCIGPAAIAGQISTEEGESLKGVLIQLSGQRTMDHTTGSDGEYEFTNLEPGYDYSITPSLNTRPVNGVSTLDLVKISKHILGVEYLASPYKVIAADANGSGTVSTLDMIQLRKLILGLITKIPGSPSWRFIDRKQVFTDSLHPWQDGLWEGMSFNDLQEPVTDADFVAVKVGDVNGSATVDNLTQATPRSNLLAPVYLYLPDRMLEAGSEIVIPLAMEDLRLIQGFQFSLHWDPDKIELQGVEEGLLQTSNFAFFPGKGVLTVSWHPYDEGLSDSSPVRLLSLRFKTEEALRLGEVLELHSFPTQSEAYNLRDEVLPLLLDFQQPENETSAFSLYQNRPNPFRHHTTVAFDLPEAMPVTLAISDTKGRVLRVYRAFFDKGYNEFEIGAEKPAKKGLYFYTIRAGAFVATKKMLILD